MCCNFVVQNVARNYSVVRGIWCDWYSVVFQVVVRVSLATPLPRFQESGMPAGCYDVNCSWQRGHYDFARQPVQVSVYRSKPVDFAFLPTALVAQIKQSDLCVRVSG